MRFRSLLIALILGSLADARADDRPNFVFFITDDVSAEDLGCYGHPLVKTPNLDKLAAGGMRFTNACLTISSCSPSRCSLITGRYPHNTGAAELHTTLPPGQFLFPQSLRDAGYYTVLSGKHHMGPNADPAFEKISKGKGPGKEEDWVQILRDRPKDRPFFAWFASTDAHRAWQINDQAPIYDPAEVPVPPYLVDGPKTRQDLADYYHEVSRTDHFAGEIAAELKRQGIEGNTYFIYTGDNGRPFPRCKTRLYDSGILPPFIVSCPGKIEPAVTDSLVSINVDLAPTILELAGVARDPRMQGVSFGKVLEDPKATVRDAAFAEHNWHVNQAHERMVREGGWLYIRNAWPERQILCVESAPGIPSGDELWEAHDKGALNPDQRDIFLVPRPAEELYNVSKDTNQLRNIAADPQNAETLARLRKLLDRWTEETGDTVPENPTPDRQDAHGKKNPDFKYGEMPGAARDATAITKPGPIRLD